MKKILAALYIFPLFFFAQSVSAESIDRYDIRMELNDDASVTISERIFYNFDGDTRHGIFRYLPRYFQVKGQEPFGLLQKRRLDFEMLSVARNGEKERFSLKKKDKHGNYFIKIGDKNRFLTGIQDYEITYKVFGSLRYFQDYDEIYWNAIGDQWSVPIHNVRVQIISQSTKPLQSSCYAGASGVSKSCDEKVVTEEGLVFRQKEVNSGFVTVAAAFPKGHFPQDERYAWGALAYVLAGVLGFMALALVILYRVRRYLYKYRVHDVVYPRYEPPKDFSPLSVGYAFDKKCDGRDISAGIIYLGQQGYLKINRIQDGVAKILPSFLARLAVDYRFVRTDKELDVSGVELPLYRELLSMIFTGKDEVLLSQISPSHAVSARGRIVKKLDSYFVDRGYVENFMDKSSSYFKFIFPLSFLSIVLISFRFFPIVFVIIFALCIFFLVLLTTLRRYTKKGWELKQELLGFKDFLMMTEKDRYEVLNSPQLNPQQFMEFLPYAIALGVEKEWAKQFSNLDMQAPEWYSGGGSAFVPGTFVDDISSLSQSLSSVSTPKSSGSGSGGGGFSGGGSGGGGGGSW